MSSVENLREFVNERLSAAAEEIFGVFKRTVVEYQEEIDRQRRLLDVFWKPEVRLHRIELPQSRVCKEEEEEAPSDQELCLQERKPSVDQEDPDSPQIKEEQEELCSSPEGEQLAPKQEAFTLTPTCEERGHGDDQLLDLCTDETESVIQETSYSNISVESTTVVELNNDHHFLPHNSHKSAFETRTRVHSDEKPFSCKTCGKGFKYSSNLKAHMRVHTGERPYSCITCGKTFTKKSTLKSHTRIHTGEKPYSCITCGKTFTKKSHLKSHTRIHTGEKPFSCITCEKTFTDTSHLKRHIRIHSGERSSTDSIVHMRRNHKGETS
ncbi:zinc finger protein 846-like [Pungitius pungitius]|uniref:zinc finger protein 846-like n=1 Tax=Pungitius pungitius TaxID=134920 RepID=UPI002E1275B0